MKTDPRVYTYKVSWKSHIHPSGKIVYVESPLDKEELEIIIRMRYRLNKQDVFVKIEKVK